MGKHRWRQCLDIIRQHEGPTLGNKIRTKEGYFPLPPNDTLQDLRTEIVQTMESLGIPIDQLLNQLSQHLPAAVDKLSPNGTLEQQLGP